MKLHRAHTKPDWELPGAGLNYWQKTAECTNGIVTPGNIASITGAVLVGVGLFYIVQNRLWLGLILLGIGRLLDLVDGAVADYTKTKSPLGEIIDATLDKIAAFAALGVFIYTGIIPIALALIIGLENAITAILSLVAKSLKRTIHPVRAGKFGGAVEWAAFIGLAIGAAAGSDTDAGRAFTVASYGLAVVSILLNGYAAIKYAQAFYSQKPKK